MGGVYEGRVCREVGGGRDPGGVREVGERGGERCKGGKRRRDGKRGGKKKEGGGGEGGKKKKKRKKCLLLCSAPE